MLAGVPGAELSFGSAVGRARYLARVTVDTTPYFKSESFACPICGAFAQQSWAECSAQDSKSGDHFDPSLNVSTCFVCRGEAVWLRSVSYGTGSRRTIGKLIHPTAKLSGPARSSDMPEEVAALYDEASTILALSPRSASALLRLALEVLLEGMYPDKQGNLNAMIGAAVADGLPERVQKTMDFMRFSGNQSVHKFHHDDTPETAATLFNLLNIVVERLITQPKQLDSLYDGLPEGFKEQIDRRDGAS